MDVETVRTEGRGQEEERGEATGGSRVLTGIKIESQCSAFTCKAFVEVI